MAESDKFYKTSARYFIKQAFRKLSGISFRFFSPHEEKH